MRQQPTMVLFQDLSPLAFKEHSYTIFVFVTADGVADETLGLPAEGDLEDLYFSHTNFAGITSVFGARGERCDNCLTPMKTICLIVSGPQKKKKSRKKNSEKKNSFQFFFLGKL